MYVRTPPAPSPLDDYCGPPLSPMFARNSPIYTKLLSLLCSVTYKCSSRRAMTEPYREHCSVLCRAARARLASRLHHWWPSPGNAGRDQVLGQLVLSCLVPPVQRGIPPKRSTRTCALLTRHASVPGDVAGALWDGPPGHGIPGRCSESVKEWHRHGGCGSRGRATSGAKAAAQSDESSCTPLVNIGPRARSCWATHSAVRRSVGPSGWPRSSALSASCQPCASNPNS